MSEETKKAIVRQGMEALFTHDGDLDSLNSTYDPGYIGHAPPFPDIIGLEAAKGFALAYRQAFPDLATTTEDLLADGKKVVVRWKTSGTHQGETEAFGPPTGNHMEITGITIQRVEDGKIVEGWTNADTLGQMHQLGMGQGP
jgi:predicted ester cyclase